MRFLANSQPKSLKILGITPRSKKDGRSEKTQTTLGLRHEVKGEYCSLRFDTVALMRSCHHHRSGTPDRKAAKTFLQKAMANQTADPARF